MTLPGRQSRPGRSMEGGSDEVAKISGDDESRKEGRHARRRPPFTVELMLVLSMESTLVLRQWYVR